MRTHELKIYANHKHKTVSFGQMILIRLEESGEMVGHEEDDRY